MRVAFAGTPQFAVPALQALLNSPHTVVGVLTQPDRPRGRGRQLAASAIKQLAAAAALPLSQPVSLRNPPEQEALRGWQPDVLVVVAYGVILPAAVLDLPRYGCINIHASLLPRWRGAAPVQRAILAGDTQTGVTIMQMDVGLDTGPMLLRRGLQIRPTDTAGTLQQRLAAAGAELLIETLAGLDGGRLSAEPQPSVGATYAAKISRGEALIDWQQTALHIERQIRAFNPVPGAETRLSGDQLKVHAARLVSDRDDVSAAPGRIVDVLDDAILVGCGKGLLALTQVQRAGRKAVAARAFAQGMQLRGQQLG
ncbi:MAG: methionyl-tRNA formyltransferase [Sinobacteraceae bacterium]|nr:methionyl-tRNA formyltransferase [Nevskiaceae bacterium]MBV9912556.1 methionyl-tRNA formyltransferase [Nevskiaceae bacterium]